MNDVSTSENLRSYTEKDFVGFPLSLNDCRVAREPPESSTPGMRAFSDRCHRRRMTSSRLLPLRPAAASSTCSAESGIWTSWNGFSHVQSMRSLRVFQERGLAHGDAMDGKLLHAQLGMRTRPCEEYSEEQLTVTTQMSLSLPEQTQFTLRICWWGPSSSLGCCSSRTSIALLTVSTVTLTRSTW